MDVTAKQKVLLQKLKQKIKYLHRKEEQSRLKMRAALDKVNEMGQAYQVRLARKMREMERRLANTEAACYAKIVLDLENQLVKGIKEKLKALAAAAKCAGRPASKVKRSSRKYTAKRSSGADRRGQKTV